VSQADSARTFTPALDGPLRVLSATPAGPLRHLAHRQPVAVTFSRPVVPLGDPPAVPDSALVLSPSVPGSLHWEGTQTLVFRPDAPLPPSTRFRARLAPVRFDRDGPSLQRPHTWTFETPRPRLRRSEPAEGSRTVARTPVLRLTFNLPVVAPDVRPFVDLPEATAWRIANDGDSTLVLSAAEALPLGTPLAVTLRAGLPTPAGPLGMAETRTLSFQVHPALRVEDLRSPGRASSDDALSPGQGVRVRFSTSVRFGDLRRAASFEPSVAWPAGIEARDGQVGTTHVLPVSLAAETAYTLRLRTLTDRFGQSISDVVPFRTRPYDPQVSMDTGRLVIEADPYPVLPLRATNVERVDLGMTRIAPDEIVPALRTYDTRSYSWVAPEQPESAPVPFQRTVDLGLKRNEPGLVPLYLDTLLTDGTGVVGIRLRPSSPEPSDRIQTALAQVTDLGLTAKFSPHGQVVLVTRLSTGRPVRGAAITLRNSRNAVLWTGTTDATGRAEAPGWTDLVPDRSIDPPGAAATRPPSAVSPLYVTAEHAGDLAFTGSLFDDGIEPYRFGLRTNWTPAPQTAAGAVFTDRRLYRTGETVHLKAILRTKADGSWSIPTDSVRLRIRNPRDEIVLEDSLRPSDRGSFDRTWTAPPEAAQGAYTVRVAALSDTTVDAGSRWRRGALATGSFRVAAFRRAQFSVTTRSAADAHVAGDFFEGSVSARYLFGAGMGGQPVRTRLVRRTAPYSPPGHAGYRFGPLAAPVDKELARQDTLLDGSSRASVRFQLPRSLRGSPAEVIWSATVTSPSRREISDRTRVRLHPARFYIGLKPASSLLDLSADTLMQVDVLTVDPGGAPVGGKDVVVELVRREWDSVRQIGADGRMRWRSEPVETVVHRRPLTTEPGAAQRLWLPVPSGGQYRLRARARDVRGNAVRTETDVYAAGAGYAAWRRSNDDRVEIHPERRRYAPGETARLLIPSPFDEATALITVEREGILDSRVERVAGSTPQIDLPITEAHLPNVYVSVILLNGRTAPPQTTSDPGAPGFKIGYTQLRVHAGSRRLRVDVTPERSTYRPGDEATVALHLRDAEGRGVAGEVTFAAVDAGVLDRVGYRLPDPFDTFYGPRPLSVTTSESRSDLVEQRSYGQKTEARGGGGGSGNWAVRTDHRPLAHWAPAVRTDARGRATVTFRFPETLTTFRLMATAATRDHHFGAGHTDVTVTKPLVVQPALPRFARAGDQFEAGVLVSNRTGAAGPVTVTAAADGLQPGGPSSKTLFLAEGATREVRFAWTAAENGTATVRFRASMQEAQDAVEHRLPVQTTRIPQTTAQFASLTGASAEESIQLPPNRIPAAGSLQVRVGTTALVGLKGALSHLFDYPYGCLEQRTSRVRPLLVGTDVLALFELDPDVRGGSRNRIVTSWLEDLSRFRAEGGLGMWPSAAAMNAPVSAYVLLTLADAQEAGFRLPQPLTRAVREAVVDAVRRSDRKPAYVSEAAWTTTRAQMLYALARHGTVLETEVSALARRPSVGPEATSWLLRTVVASRSPVLDRYERSLADRLREQVRVEGSQAYLDRPAAQHGGFGFASTVRATALGLTALLEAGAGPDVQPLAERMIRFLMRVRSGGRWASTQDNAAALDAFRAYADAYEDVLPNRTARVLLAGREILSASFQGRTLRPATAAVEAARLPSGRTLPLQVQADGRGRLYYTIRVQTATDGPVRRASRGLRVQRQIRRLDDRGEPVGGWIDAGGGRVRLEAGRLVQVRLRLASPVPRAYVVVDDALPAALEPVQTDFATTDAGLSDRVGTGTWWGSFNHTEVQDDRVLLFADHLRAGEHTYTYLARATTPGTVHHPPAHAEQMYAPETNGRTGSGSLRVAPPSPPPR
jgi:hypothetical protein